MADVRGEDLPEVVSHFRVAERLGSGGMGTVCKGYDRRDDTPVAIKFLHPHLAYDPSFRERFEREAHVASLLTSPYTVHVQETGETDGRFYIVMDYVEGHTLKDALESGPLPLNRALRIALQVSRALEAAHAQNIVHRDIKPENVFLSGEDSVKVGDFGIARQEGGASVTVTGAFIGTLTYAAPEQMLGKADRRSDIYALGATLYHMLAGRPPFSGTVQEMLRLVPEVPPPREPLAGQPAAVVEIVVRCLAKDPDERYQTAAELSAAIGRASRPGSAVVTEDETIVDQPAEETSATLLEEMAPTVPSGRPSVAMTLGPPRTASPMARLRSTRYDLTVTNDGDAPAELELAATDEAGSCRFSLRRRVSVAPGSATTLSMGVRPGKRRWRGGDETHRFTVSASGAGDGPPASVSGDFTDLPYGWLPFGGVLSVGGVAAVVAVVLLLGGGSNGSDFSAVPELEDGVLNVGSDIVFPPFEFLRAGAVTPDGLDIDLAEAIAAELGVDVEFLNTGFDVIIPALEAEDFDVLISAMTITDARSEVIDFVPYITVGTGIVVPAGNPDGIGSIEDLCGKTVAVQVSTMQEDILLEAQDESCDAVDVLSIRIFDTNPLAVEDVRTGGSDANFSAFPVAGEAAALSEGALEVVDTQIDPEPYGLGVRKTSTELKTALSDALQAIIADGTYDTILARWDLAAVALQ